MTEGEQVYTAREPAMNAAGARFFEVPYGGATPITMTCASEADKVGPSGAQPRGGG